jgi:hypothetical protein
VSLVDQAVQSLLIFAQKMRKHPIEDTGDYDATKEKAIRDIATRIGAYAEAGPTFDPEGNYLCGDCALREEPSTCTHVSGKIDMRVGGCFIWIIGDEIHQPIGEKLTQIEAMYCTRPKAKGFGCHRCSWGAEAKKADSDGRPSWCGFWGFHVKPFACCFAETGPDLKEAPGE